MAKPSIEQVRGLSDLAVMYNWDISFVNFPSAAPDHPDSEAFNLRCVSTALPKATLENIETNIRGHRVHQAGQISYSNPIALNFIETIDVVINSFLRSWREACYQTGTGVQQSKSDVECDMQFHLLDRQGNPIYEWLLHGCRLEDYDPTGGDLSGESNDSVKPSMSIRYVYFEDKKL